ncbi:chromate transporter [Candidatus Allofournierella excrementavium]|uniref:chromate transporter n=1 Tax=Candidatus Allofournierella excrementavium TaxID=2838591 RepID=UPI003AF9FD13
MKSKLKKYATLFLSTFQLSAFTFGGGFVIIPLIRKKFVEQLGWIGEEEMLDLAAIAQSSPGAIAEMTPGPIAINSATFVGIRVAGIPGALLTMVGTVTPPLIIISVISLFYAAFRDNVFVNMAMCGMLAGVAAVILDVVLRLAKDIFRQKRVLPVLILAGAFVANRFLNVNIIVIILACATFGVLDLMRRQRSAKGAA